jgi:hypothetical protein
MRNLYEIGAAESDLQNLLLGIGGEISDDEVGQELERYMADLEEERDGKLRRICGLISNFEIDAEASKAQAAAIEAEIKDLKRSAQVAENAADRLKKRVLQYFTEHGHRKIDLGIFKPNVRDNASAPVLAKAWEDDPRKAPAQFQKVTLDKAGIGIALKALGADVQLCPICGEAADITDFCPESGAQETPTASCDCGFIGDPTDTVRFGPKGQHLRLR